jgi:chaperone required for assembly of F1-ATPase
MNDKGASWEASIRSAQADMRSAAIKRFYKSAEVAETDAGFALTLDGRTAMTPAKAKLAAPTRALAEAIAAEWQAQGETLTPAAMPLTRLANSAIDGVQKAIEQTIDEIAGFAGTDLVCYRATEPQALAERQAEAFDPVLAFAAEAFGARFALAGGLMPVAQPEASLRAIRDAVAAATDPFALTALHALTSLSGSALIGLAVARGAMSAEAAWRAAHVDEDFQIERWGADDEAMARRAARFRDFAAAARALEALRGA